MPKAKACVELSEATWREMRLFCALVGGSGCRRSDALRQVERLKPLGVGHRWVPGVRSQYEHRRRPKLLQGWLEPASRL